MLFVWNTDRVPFSFGGSSQPHHGFWEGRTTAPEDIAGRQRILIQRMCKKALLMSHGVSRAASAKKLEESSLLYEESKDGLVFGIPAAGVPELEELCTMHQMRDVHFYYEQAGQCASYLFSRGKMVRCGNPWVFKIASKIITN